MPQRHHRIHFRGPAGGNIASHQCDEYEENCNGREGERIICAHAVEHADNEARDAHGCGNTHCYSNNRKEDSLSDDKTQEIAPLCAEGHPDAELMRSPRNFTRNKPYDPMQASTSASPPKKPERRDMRPS
jgi:hypothetical protein